MASTRERHRHFQRRVRGLLLAGIGSSWLWCWTLATPAAPDRGQAGLQPRHPPESRDFAQPAARMRSGLRNPAERHSARGHRPKKSDLLRQARNLNAERSFAEAKAVLDRVRTEAERPALGSEGADSRSWSFAAQEQYFDLYVEVLMNLHEQHPRQGYDRLALEVNERRQARGLLEELGRAGAVHPQADPALAKRRSELEAEIERTEKALLDVQGTGAGAAAERPLEQTQRALLGELDRVRKALPRAGSQARAAHRQPLTVREMQGLLDPRTVLLVYALGEARGYLWLVTDRGLLASHTLHGRAWFEERVEIQTRKGNRKGGALERKLRWARELSRDLLGGVARQLGERRLLIVADWALRELSFAALPDPNQTESAEPEPLLARHEIVYLPSASVLSALRYDLRGRAPAPRRLLLVADPVFERDDPRVTSAISGSPAVSGPPTPNRAGGVPALDPFRPLPFSGQEAAAIAGLLPAGEQRLLSGFGASLDSVERELGRYSIVHFATHGLVHPRHPELSGLVLSQVAEDGSRRQGFLRAHRIADLDLQADLAVLSACETGVAAELEDGEGQALSRSFLRAGVPRLVVSLWEVSDEATSELMGRFYRAMLQHRLAPAQALRCAQLSLSGDERWSDPFYWAPFVFQGDWEDRLGRPPAGPEPRTKCPDLAATGIPTTSASSAAPNRGRRGRHEGSASRD